MVGTLGVQTSNNYIARIQKKLNIREALVTPVAILGAIFLLISWLPIFLFGAFSGNKYWWRDFWGSKNSSIGSKSKDVNEKTPKSIDSPSKSANANNNDNKHDDNSCCYQTRKTGRYYCHCGRTVVSRLPVKVTTYKSSLTWIKN